MRAIAQQAVLLLKELVEGLHNQERAILSLMKSLDQDLSC